MEPSEQLQAIAGAWKKVRDVRATQGQGTTQQDQGQAEQTGIEEDLGGSDAKKTKPGGDVTVWKVPESPDAGTAAPKNRPPVDKSNPNLEKQSEKDDPDAILYENGRARAKAKAKARAEDQGGFVPLPPRK